jgi:hypothetical protein
LPLFDGLTGRDTLQNGTIENKRKPGSVELVNSVAPPTPAEHAILEAAIQMDLITPEQAEALVEKGKTLGEWPVEREKGKAVEARNVEQRMLDALAVLALLLRSVDGLRMDRFTDREVAVVSDRTPSLPDTVALRLAHTEDSEAGASGHTRERYNLLTGTSLMFGSILRCPRLSMIQGWSRYGGNSSAAVLGNRTCCCSTETVRPVGGRGRIRSDRTEYPSIVLHLPRNRWVRC